MTRQYCGALGKIANCQVAATALLWAKGRAWMLGATLYLPKEWTRDGARCERVYVPPTIRFQEKCRLALTLVRRARAAGMTVTAVVADVAYGDVTVFREPLHRLNLPYALGISSNLTVFVGTPRTARPETARRRGRPPTRFRLLDAAHPIAVRKVAATLPARAWRRISWQNEQQPTPWEGRFRCAACDAGSRLARGTSFARGVAAAATTSRPLHRRQIFLHSSSGDDRAEATRLDCAPAMGHRAAISAAQRRTFPGWNRHVVLTAVAYTFLQQERRHTRGKSLTFPMVRALVCEIFTALYFAAHPKQLDSIIQLRRHLPLRI